MFLPLPAMLMLKEPARRPGGGSSLRPWIYGGSGPRFLLEGSRIGMSNLARRVGEKVQRRGKEKIFARGNEKDPAVAVRRTDHRSRHNRT